MHHLWYSPPDVVNLRFYIKIKLKKYKRTLDNIEDFFEPPSKYCIYWKEL